MNYRGAWVRYGGPIAAEEVLVAATRCSVAILQPWEGDVAARLKAARPDMTVLQYRCLSSVREYEPGPVLSSGVSFAQAEASSWFAERTSGGRIEWHGYPGHWQVRHWDHAYRRAWIDNVVADLTNTAFDGVMADNDVYDDYYGLGLPLADGTTIADLRASLDEFVPLVGRALRSGGWRLVPNVAESRRDPGRWARHGAFGGAFEECWLSWAPGVFLGVADQRAQLAQVAPDSGPELVVARIATDGRSDHPSFRYGLAAWWLAGAGRAGGFAATGHDQYSGSPWIPEMDWDLGRALTPARGRGSRRYRRFENGWVGLHLGPADGGPVRMRPPPRHVDRHGAVPRYVTVEPHHGVILRAA